MTDMPDWLEQLEARVHEATETLRALREDKTGLEEKVAELEERLASAEDAASADVAAEWQAERDEIRRRVEALVDKLAGLVEG